MITAPATDEVFMREYIKEWKRLMQARPNARRSRPRALNSGAGADVSPKRDPARESWYVGDEFYRDLAAAFTDWAREDKRSSTRRCATAAARFSSARRASSTSADSRTGSRSSRRSVCTGCPGRRRRRSADGGRGLVRRPAAAREPRLSAAHRLCVVAGPPVAHGAADRERRGVCRRAKALFMVRSNVPRRASSVRARRARCRAGPATGSRCGASAGRSW